MIKDLKIALIKSGISMTEFAKSIGKSRATVYQVATGKATSAPVTAEIEKFIKNPSSTFRSLSPQNVEFVPTYLTTEEFAKLSGLKKSSVSNNCLHGRYRNVLKQKNKWLIHKSELGVTT